MGWDKLKRQQKVGLLTKESAASVKEFISKTTQTQEKGIAQKWDVIQTAITNIPNTAQQFLELQAMAGAPEEERNRYFALIRQRAMLDAEIKLSQSQLQMQKNECSHH